MTSRWLLARQSVLESIENFPVTGKDKEWLQALFDESGDGDAATAKLYPDSQNKNKKTKSFYRRLSPYILQASVHHGGAIIPRATGIVLELAEGQTKDGTGVETDPQTRLKAATYLIDRYDHLVGVGLKDSAAADAAVQAVKEMAQSIDSLARTLIASMGREQALKLLEKDLGKGRLELLKSKLGIVEAEDAEPVQGVLALPGAGGDRLAGGDPPENGTHPHLHDPLLVPAGDKG